MEKKVVIFAWYLCVYPSSRNPPSLAASSSKDALQINWIELHQLSSSQIVHIIHLSSGSSAQHEVMTSCTSAGHPEGQEGRTPEWRAPRKAAEESTSRSIMENRANF